MVASRAPNLFHIQQQTSRQYLLAKYDSRMHTSIKLNNSSNIFIPKRSSNDPLPFIQIPSLSLLSIMADPDEKNITADDVKQEHAAVVELAPQCREWMYWLRAWNMEMRGQLHYIITDI